MASATPSILVDKPRSLVDEKVDIRLTGLPSNALVTVRLQIRESYGSFSAWGHYQSDSSGRLCLSDCASIGGTYVGNDSMGLFWSLRQDPSDKAGLRLLRREAEIPLRYQLTAFLGHLDWDSDTPAHDCPSDYVCSANLERTYLADSVERIPVKCGRIRGSLFKPRAKSSYPAIIDLFGTGGGLMEHRAALLAKEGFSVLSLAYFNYQDLPKEFHEVDMDYFEEAVDYMLESPYNNRLSSSRGGLGIIGVSAGADIVANAAILLGDKIRAAVWINGNPCQSWYPVKYRGSYLPNVFQLDLSRAKLAEPNPLAIDYRDAVCPDCGVDKELPVELATCRFLFLSCLDDYSVSPDSGARLVARLKRAGRTDVEHVTYPDAGHLLEPPISPCTPLCYHGVFKIYMYYGGKSDWHHRAQVDSWARMIRLFREELGGCSDDAATKARL